MSRGKPRGRPSSLKDPVRSAILKAIQVGAPFTHAVKAAGISYPTFCDWRNKGRADIETGKQSEFAKFFNDVEKARSRHVVNSLQIITKAAKKTWTAAAWKLERLHPEHFALNRDLLRDLLKKQAELDALVRQLLAERAAAPESPGTPESADVPAAKGPPAN